VNGDLVTATATNRYSDLFKALKVGIASPAFLVVVDECTLISYSFLM
jgi:hypothetical protein